LAFSLGIVAGRYCWRPPLWWISALIVLTAAALFWRKTRPRAASLLSLGALLLLGALRTQVAPEPAPPPEITRLGDAREVVITGHVTRDAVRHGLPATRHSLDLEAESIEADGERIGVTTGIRLTIYRQEVRDEDGEQDTGLPSFTYGQRLRFPATLRPPRNFGNPGALDYRGWLAAKGIFALAAVRADKVEVLPGIAGTHAGLWRSRIRGSILARTHALWPAPQAALLDAMLIGERAHLGRDTNLQFQRTGAYHILVVSGMNVGILALVTFWVLRRFRVGEIGASAATVVLAFAYAYLADAGAPILRAALMLALYLGTRLLYRDRALLNAVGAAALGLLAFDPRGLFDASFQLTFVSVLAIAGIGLPALERTSLPYRRGLRYLDSAAYDFALPARVAQFRLDLRLIASRIASLVPAPWAPQAAHAAVSVMVSAALAAFDILLISALMQVALALPMAVYFHRATVVGLPANALVAPLTGVLMPAAGLAVLLGHLWMPLAKVPALVTTFMLKGITGTVSFLGGWSVADVRVATPSWIVSAGAAVAFAGATILARRSRALAAAGWAALLASAAWIAIIPPKPQLRPGVLEITHLDVGQAESALIVTPQGRTLLVDAAGPLGPSRSEFDFGEDVISPYLWSRGITRLDAIALSHAHSDHMGGLPSVIANFRPREFWLGPNATTPALVSLLRHAQKHGTSIVDRRAGDDFMFGGSRVQVLAPPRDWALAARPRNNDSLVMRISHGETSALLTADAEKKIERLLALHENARADLLKVGHNGSASSTTPEFLSAVRPRWALISVGRNRFGHPRGEVLGRLQSAKVTTYRTDTAGAVTFYLDGSAISVRPAVLLR
jgi:competence protein ComEC